MSDVQDRLREKTLQIAQLQQKIDVLQAQLQGTHRRSGQLNENLAELERTIATKDQEIHALRTELSRTQGALESVGKEIQGIRAEQSERLGRSRPETEEHHLREEIAESEIAIKRLREAIRTLSMASIGVLNGEPEATSILRDAVLNVGDAKYKALLLVLGRKSIKIDELASQLVIDVSRAHAIADELQSISEVEIKNDHSVVPGRKYRDVTIPVDNWKNLEPQEIFDSLEETIGRMSDKESVSKAIEAAVDILEQKLARGGALVFEMRRTADNWKKIEGNTEELRYLVREWKGRAMSFQ